MKDDIQLRPSFRSLHLFLQTHLDMDRIRENADGVRDDQVAKYFQLLDFGPLRAPAPYTRLFRIIETQNFNHEKLKIIKKSAICIDLFKMVIELDGSNIKTLFLPIIK
jgi:hypothetical protein